MKKEEKKKKKIGSREVTTAGFKIKGNELKTPTKTKLCKSVLKSILLYNCGTCALTLTEKERLNAYNRKQQKNILKLRYPKKIINELLCRFCQEWPLSIQII